MIAERFLDPGQDLAAALSARIAARLAEAIATRGRAALVATGGSTPGPLYDALSRADVAWERVAVTLSDERWADPTDAASNERLVRARLLQRQAACARLVGFKTAAATPAEAVGAIDAALAALAPFDVTLLGMGTDGHVASLFPDGEELTAALDPQALRVCPVHRPGAAGSPDRLSLTRQGLLDTGLIIVLIEGADKLAVYRRASAGQALRALPIRMILQQNQTPVEVWWRP